MKFVLLLVALLLAVTTINAQVRYDIPWGNSEASSSPITVNASWSQLNYFVWRFLDNTTLHTVLSTTTDQGAYSESQLTPGYNPNQPGVYPFRSEAMTAYNSEGQQNYFAAVFQASSNATPPGVYYFRDSYNSNLYGLINLMSESSSSPVAASSAVIRPVSITAATFLVSSAPPASLLSPSQTPASSVINFPIASGTVSAVTTPNPSANPSSTAVSPSAPASASIAASLASTPSNTPISSSAASASASRAVASVAASISASASRAAFSNSPSASRAASSNTATPSPQLTSGSTGGNSGQGTTTLSASPAASRYVTATATPSASPCTKDTDGDGVPDCFDLCPRNKKKTAPSGPYGCSDTPKSSHTIIEFDFDILSPMNCTELY